MPTVNIEKSLSASSQRQQSVAVRSAGLRAILEAQAIPSERVSRTRNSGHGIPNELSPFCRLICPLALLQLPDVLLPLDVPIDRSFIWPWALLAEIAADACCAAGEAGRKP